MNLPDWLSLSATSGTGSGKITATVDKCTARAARRTTEFSVKTDSGSSRRVRVIQNGIAEFVSITTQDISLPAVLGGQTGTLAIAGTSNSAILTVVVSGTLQLTTSSYTVTDENGDTIAFVSGSPIEGDPGAEAAYSYSLVLNYTDNPTNEVISSSVTVVAQSGESASINVSQAAGSHGDITVPVFTINEARNISAAATSEISPAVVVYDPNEVGWDILTVPAAGITTNAGLTTNYLTPITVSVGQNDDTENGRSFVLYLVPEGAVNTSVVFSSIVVNQAAAPVNPFIEGDEQTSSYAGGLVTLRVIDQKRVGWYPEVLFAGGIDGDNAGASLLNQTYITGNGDVRGNFSDTPIETVFNQEYGNTKIVGDGIVKIRINDNAVSGDAVTLNLRVSKDDITTEPYDYVVINVSNIPQFDYEDYEVIIPPYRPNVNNAYLIEQGLSLLTIGNPEAVPFIILTRNNGSAQRKVSMSANGYGIYDEVDGLESNVFTNTQLTIDLEASELGAIEVMLMSPDKIVTFSHLNFTIYRQPVLKFATLNPDWQYDQMIRVTEPFTNVATAYKHYGDFSGNESYNDADIISNAVISYSLIGDLAYNIVDFDATTGTVRGKRCIDNNFNDILVRASIEESGYYKSAEATYRLRVVHTKAYIDVTGLEDVVIGDVTYKKKVLYIPGTDGYPDNFLPQYNIVMLDYSSGTPVQVPYNSVYPDSPISVVYTMANEYGWLEQDMDGTIRVTDFPPGGVPFGQVSIAIQSNEFVEDDGENINNHQVFLVFVEQNDHFVMQITAGWDNDEVDPPYLFENVESSGVSPKPITVSVYTDMGENQNLKPLNHVLRFRVDSVWNYIGENGERKIIDGEGNTPAGFNITRDISSSAITTPAATRDFSVALLSNVHGLSGKTITVESYEDTTYTKPFASKSFMISQKASEGSTLEIRLIDNDDLLWYETVGGQGYSEYAGLPCYQSSNEYPDGGHKFDFQLRSTDPDVNVADRTISVAYQYFIYDPTAEDYQGRGPWRSGDADVPQGWLHLRNNGTDYTIETGEEGVVNGITIDWNINSESSVIRACEITLSTEGMTNPAKYFFYQKSYSVQFTVKFFSDDVEVTTRTVASNYTESEPAYTARAYLNGVQIDSSSERLTITYSSSDGVYVTVNPDTGLISNLNVGTARIEADARYRYDISEELYYEGTGSYQITIERAKTRPEIHTSIPTGLVYRDTNNYEFTAWSDSGAEVFIIPQPTTQLQDAIVLGSRTVVEEDGKVITKQSFHLLSPSVAEATSTHKRVATDANGISILFTCAAVGDWLDATASGSLVIGRYFDYVVDWGITASNPAWIQYGGGTTSRIYTITTASGNDPVSVSASSNSTQTNKVVLTWPYNGNKKKVRVTSNAYTVNSGPDPIWINSPLRYDNYNYGLIGIDDGGTGSDYGNAYYKQIDIYQYPDSPISIDRSVSFDRSVYSVPVGATTPTSLVFNPSGATGGTPTYTVVSGGNNFSINSSGVITGSAKTSTNGVIRVNVTAANGYSGCTATASVEVGKASTSISFREQSLSLDAGEISYVLATLSPTISGAKVYYSAYGFTDIISVQRQSDGSCKVTAKAAGSFRIRAYYDGNDNYAGSEAFLYGSVDSVIQDCTITLQPTSFELYSGSSMNLAPYVSYTPSGANVSYEITSGGSYASLAGDMVTAGSVSSNATALVKITVEKAGMNPASATASITVKPQSVNTQTVTLSPTLNSIYEVNNDSAQYPYQTDLNPSVNPSGGTIQYSYSPNNGYLTISSAGRVTANQGAGGTSGITYTITGRRQLSGYSDGVGTATLTVYPVPSVDPTPSTPVDRQDAIIWHPVPSEAVSLQMNGIYENLATSQSERAVSFASSNGTKADVISARVNIPSNAETGTVVLSLTLETSPEVVETCTLAVTTTASDSKNGRQVDWTRKSQTINVNAGDSFILMPKTDTSVASAYRLTIPNSVHTTSEKYIHWNTGDSTRASVSGGVVVPLAMTDSNITIKARVQTYTDTTANIRWLAASSYYTLSVSKVVPDFRFKYSPSDLQGGGTEFYFSRGSDLPEDFNIPLYNGEPIASYSFPDGRSFVWGYGGNGSNNTGRASVSPSGIVTIGNDYGLVEVKASITGNDIYEAVEASYLMNIVSYKVVITYANGNRIPDGQSLQVGGQGGSVTVRAYYFNTIDGQGDVAYDDTPIIPTYCSAISPNDSLPDPQTGMYRTSNILAKYHTITFHLDRNMSGSSYETTREIFSNIGGASAILSILQGAGGGGQGDTEHEQYVITRSDSIVVEENHYWGTGGFAFGDEHLIPASYAGTDETYAIDIAQDAAQKLSWQTTTGGTQQLWWEVQDWHKSGSDKRIDTSSGRVSIQYEVLISDDGNTWTATTSSSWFWGYLGDGNSQSTSTDIKLYGAGGFLLNAQNKFYPHIAWTQNTSTNPRYGKVILYYLQSGSYKMGRVEIMFTQQGTNS